MGNCIGETQNGLPRLCCSPGNLASPQHWKLLSANEYVVGKRDCLQICHPADPRFLCLNIYFALVENFCLRVLCHEEIPISLAFQAGAPSCSGLPLIYY